MAGDEITFEGRAEDMLARVFERLEAADADTLEVEFEAGVLTVEVEDAGTFLLNKHAPLQQLWLSSPLSGASHYAFDAASGRWLSTRDGTDLAARLAAELTTATGADVSLD